MFFHLCQSLYKEIQALGLAEAYLNNEDVRLACRSTMALALLPLEHIQKAFELLKNNSPEEMEDVFHYFEHQWLKRVLLQYWNVPTLEFRTNNFAEGNFVFLKKYIFVVTQVGTISLIIESKNIILMFGT